MKNNNEYYITEYVETRGLSKATHKLVGLVLNNYSKFQQLSLQELLNEADNEEEQGIRWKKRTLKTRLINYMNHVRKKMAINSAKTYLKIVKSFYTHNEIEIHKLPKFNSINSNIVTPVTYRDLPNKEIIKQAVNIAEPLMKALILFLSSSGISKIDALNLQISSFIEATVSYHNNNKMDLLETLFHLQSIAENTDIIPTFRMRRQKTKKYFITFCSHEATMEIINYLIHRNSKKELKDSDKLFKIEEHQYTLKFQQLNNALGLQKVGFYNRFRGHMLRKYHASNLAKAGMDRYLVNVLQGKSNGKVDDVYFFEDEEQLREEYLKHMHSLLIFTEVREVDKYSQEFLDIQEENTKLKEQLSEIKKMQKELDKIKEWFDI